MCSRSGLGNHEQQRRARSSAGLPHRPLVPRAVHSPSMCTILFWCRKLRACKPRGGHAGSGKHAQHPQTAAIRWQASYAALATSSAPAGTCVRDVRRLPHAAAATGMVQTAWQLMLSRGKRTFAMSRATRFPRLCQLNSRCWLPSAMTCSALCKSRAVQSRRRRASECRGAVRPARGCTEKRRAPAASAPASNPSFKAHLRSTPSASRPLCRKR